MPQHVFVDGRDKLDAPCDCDAVIGGDGIVMSIAAASIIAKVTRDRLMCALALDCPGYGFENHKGYAVPEHREALDRLGPSIHHRRFFAPVIAARLKHYPETVEGSDGRTRSLHRVGRRRLLPRFPSARSDGRLPRRRARFIKRSASGPGRARPGCISDVSCVSPRWLSN